MLDMPISARGLGYHCGKANRKLPDIVSTLACDLFTLISIGNAASIYFNGQIISLRVINEFEATTELDIVSLSFTKLER
jgi:hypothetical protein